MGLLFSGTMSNDADSDISSFSSSSDEEEEEEEDNEVYTPRQILEIGLRLLHWTDERINKVKYITNLERFRTEYGLDNFACAQLWEDIKSVKINNDKIPGRKQRDIKSFFMALHFLKRYPTELERTNKWKVSENTLRRDTWHHVELIRALKHVKIGWPADNFGNDIWVLTVDGTHFRTQEPASADIPKDPAYFSFKHHCAGFNYELGIALRESKLVWMNGPYEAGTYNDIKIFRDCGLKEKLQSTGKKAIADHGYQGYPKLISISNSHDSKEVRSFKSRARLRQEKYNGMCKNFECLDSRFRGTKEQLQACFEAVAVLVQYRMDFGEPLYDI